MNTHRQNEETSPYRSASDLQSLLEQVFAARQPDGDLLSRQKLALAFVFTAPDLSVSIDGRSGAGSVVSFGQATQATDLTFSMSGQTAHPFWTGDLNVVTALGLGQIRLQGSLLNALKIAPMMPAMQAAYRAAWTQRGKGGG